MFVKYKFVLREFSYTIVLLFFTLAIFIDENNNQCQIRVCEHMLSSKKVARNVI